MALATQKIFSKFPLLRAFSGLNVKHSFSYKSAISLENVYPTSKLTLTTPSKAPDSDEKFNGYIPLKDLVISYSRSSGPGGQNVNTLSTKVDLRLHLESAEWLHPEIKAKMLDTHKNKLNKDGYLVIKSELTRQQHLNLADALSKLRKMIWVAAAPPPPPLSEESQEKLRRRREKAARERLLEKRNRSSTKQGRQAPSLD